MRATKYETREPLFHAKVSKNHDPSLHKDDYTFFQKDDYVSSPRASHSYHAWRGHGAGWEGHLHVLGLQNQQ